MSELLLPQGSARAQAVIDAARSAWRRSLVVRLTLSAIALALAAAALLLAIDLLIPLPVAARSVVRWLPILVLAAAALVGVRRLLPGPDNGRLALLVEERNPQLGHTLSTLLGRVGDGPVAKAFRERAEALLHGVDGGAVAPIEARAPGAALAAALAVLLLLVAIAPGGAAGAWQRWAVLEDAATATATSLSTPTSGPGGATSAFVDLSSARLTVEPPAYTGLPAGVVDGEMVTALPGSRIRIEGSADARTALHARVIGGAELIIDRNGTAWSSGWVLGAGERGLEVEAVSEGEVVGRRVVPLLLLPDDPPVVGLVEPAEDVVAAAPRGEITLRATATDDYGVRDFHLAWIRSRGSGESFSFEEGRWAWDDVVRSGRSLEATYALDLATLGLQAGDLIHIRAVARDGNTVTGPGEGASRTRVIRIAREEELGEVTILSGFPIEAERDPILSQRMIILLTERLIESAPEMGRAELREESAEIADQQARLRLRVGDQALARTTGTDDAHDHEAHNHDADPILSVNQPLLDAYNLMWSSEGSLRIAELSESLPYQYEALRILQEAREAERVFVRGRVGVAPIDVAEARGTGEMQGVEPGARTRGEPLPGSEARLAEVEALLPRLATMEPGPASLELGALAARLLADPNVDPTAAALVVEAAEVARREQPVEAAAILVRARALLAPGGALADGIAAPAIAPGDHAAASYFRQLGQPR